MLMAPNYDINDMRGDPNKLGAVPDGVTTVDSKKSVRNYKNHLTSGARTHGGQLISSLTAVSVTVY